MTAGSRIARVIAAALLGAASPAFAQPAPASASLTPALTTVAPLPETPAVNAFYQLRGNAPIWLRDAASAEAARMLPAILRRAPLDGLANGPDLARRVEDAIARAQAAEPVARPAALVAADKLLSAAWVQYVRALRAPVRDMAWGDPALAPRVPNPHVVLASAVRAPALTRHVKAVSDVNPIYAELRAAAWSKLQLEGRSGPDARLLANLDRARLLPSDGRFVAVNAATQQLWMVEDGRIVDSMKVVVGKRDTPTPMLAGTIHYVTFNPYWNIPTDVARRTVAPLVIKRGTKYLRAARYEVISGWSNEASLVPPDTVDWQAVADGTIDAHIRQLPGPENMMGALKFGFVNDLGIYLHDTPHRELFGKDQRTFSLGCVRVEDAPRLARWFLGREPAPPSDLPEQSVQLPRPVPVYISYWTASADGGRLAFVGDVYGRDPKPETGLAALEPVGSAASGGGGLLVDASGAPSHRRD